MANWKELAFKGDVVKRSLNFFSNSTFIKGMPKKTGSGGVSAGEFGYLHILPSGNSETSTSYLVNLRSSASDGVGVGGTTNNVEFLGNGIDTTGSTSNAARFGTFWEASNNPASSVDGWRFTNMNGAMEVPYGSSSSRNHHFNINVTIFNDDTTASSTSPVYHHFSLWRGYLSDNDNIDGLVFRKVQDLKRANTTAGLFLAPTVSGNLKHYRAEPFDVPLSSTFSDPDEVTCVYVLGVLVTDSAEFDTDAAIAGTLDYDWPSNDARATFRTNVVVEYQPADWP